MVTAKIGKIKSKIAASLINQKNRFYDILKIV